jgi:mono/diheme cytochrome c family protein
MYAASGRGKLVASSRVPLWSSSCQFLLSRMYSLGQSWHPSYRTMISMKTANFNLKQFCAIACPGIFASDSRSPTTAVGDKAPEVIMPMCRILLFGFLLLGVSVADAQTKPAVESSRPSRPNTVSGKQTYVEYCSSCHGANARGDGPVASALKTAPADLTTLAKRNGGKFPYERVSDVLRFGTGILSHGSSDMPIWGPVFGSLANYDELAVKKRIKDLSDYLASLQQKDS